LPGREAVPAPELPELPRARVEPSARPHVGGGVAAHVLTVAAVSLLARARARAALRRVENVRYHPGAGREGAADENEERADQQDTRGKAEPLHVSTPSERAEALGQRVGREDRKSTR